MQSPPRQPLQRPLIVGGALLGLAVVAAAAGVPHWSPLIMATIVGLIAALWRRQILRPDVTRTAPDEVIIRFAPWYEGFVYSAILIGPVTGLTMLATALSHPAPIPANKLQASVMLLVLSLFILLGCARARRRCWLRITPTTLHSSVLFVRWVKPTQQLIAPESDRLLRRDQIDQIVAWNTPRSPVDRRFTALGFRPTPDAELIRRDVGGPQLTVEPDNLLHALQAWKDADPSQAPAALIDRIEACLRGRPGTGPEHQHWGGGSDPGGKGVVGAVMLLGDAAAGVYRKSPSDPEAAQP